MKYVEKHFTLRIHRRDGTSKLLLGVTGNPPKIGSANEEVLEYRYHGDRLVPRQQRFGQYTRR